MPAFFYFLKNQPLSFRGKLVRIGYMRRLRKKIRIIWIVISVIAVLSMIGFLIAPAFYGF